MTDTPTARDISADADNDADMDAEMIAALERGDDLETAFKQFDARKAAKSASTRRRIRDAGWTPEKQRAFVVHLAATGCVTHACAHVGLSKQSAYALRNRYPESYFAYAWAIAARLGRQRLFDEVMERAIAGREVPVWHRGEQVGTRIVYNDRLIMSLLKYTPEPAHPVLADRELAELWPTLLRNIDMVLPSTFTPGRVREIEDR